MRRAYPYLITAACAIGCDEPIDAPTDEAPGQAAAVVDGRVSAPVGDASAMRPPRGEDAPAAEADARVALDPNVPSSDGGMVDAGMAESGLDADASPRGPGLHEVGKTCLGPSNDLIGCALEQCVPAQVLYVDDGSGPYSVECTGPCPSRTWPKPAPVDGDVLLTYAYHSTQQANVSVMLFFDRTFEGATTLEQARAALFAPPSFIFGKDYGDPSSPGNEQVSAGASGPAELIAFDGRRVRLKGHAELTSTVGPSIFAPHYCGPSGDSPLSLPGICPKQHCSFAAAEHGGTGTPGQVDVDVTFDLF